MKIKITEIGMSDAFYHRRELFLGRTGTLLEDKGDFLRNGYRGFNILFDDPIPTGDSFDVTYYPFAYAKYEVIGEDTVNLEVKFDRKTAKKLEKLAKKWNLSQEETLVRILTEITKDVTPDELAAFE